MLILSIYSETFKIKIIRVNLIVLIWKIYCTITKNGTLLLIKERLFCENRVAFLLAFLLVLAFHVIIKK